MAVERLVGQPVRVVVADDDDDTRAVLVRLLDGSEELDVVGAAPDLDATVDLVDEHGPDVVLLDRVMPGVDGPATIERLRRRAAMPAIVVVSGYGRDDPEVAALADAADGYVEKGAPRATLVGTVLRSVRRARAEPRADPATVEGMLSLDRVADALHDGAVQALSGALWTLDALERATDDGRREDLIGELRVTLQSALASTRRLMRWARQGDNGADPPR